MVFASIAGLLGGVLAAVLTYKNGKRTAAGTVSTSDARTVWERQELAYRTMKEMYESRIKELEDANEELRQSVKELENKVAKLESEILNIITKRKDTSNGI